MVFSQLSVSCLSIPSRFLFCIWILVDLLLLRSPTLASALPLSDQVSLQVKEFSGNLFGHRSPFLPISRRNSNLCVIDKEFLQITSLLGCCCIVDSLHHRHPCRAAPNLSAENLHKTYYFFCIQNGCSLGCIASSRRHPFSARNSCGLADNNSKKALLNCPGPFRSQSLSMRSRMSSLMLLLGAKHVSVCPSSLVWDGHLQTGDTLTASLAGMM